MKLIQKNEDILASYLHVLNNNVYLRCVIVGLFNSELFLVCTVYLCRSDCGFF